MHGSQMDTMPGGESAGQKSMMLTVVFGRFATALQLFRYKHSPLEAEPLSIGPACTAGGLIRAVRMI